MRKIVLFSVVFLLLHLNSNAQCNPVITKSSDSACVAGKVLLCVDLPGNYNSFAWSTGETTPCIYVGSGTYTVTTVDFSLCTGTTSVTIINRNQPVASFTSSPSGRTINLTNTSTNYTGFGWSFGDGINGTVSNTSHTYTFDGQYNVCLSVTANGCAPSYACSTIVAGQIYTTKADSQWVRIESTTSCELLNFGLTQDLSDSGFITSYKKDCAAQSILKFNKHGMPLWAKSTDVSGDVINVKNGYINSGYSSNGFYTLDTNGNIKNVRRFNPYHDLGFNIVSISQNTFAALAGSGDTLIYSLFDFNGNNILNKNINILGIDELYLDAVSRTSNKDVLINATSYTNLSGTYGQMIIRVDSLGNVLWAKSIGNVGNPENEPQGRPCADASGNSYFAGDYFNVTQFKYIVKVNSSGNLVDSRLLNFNFNVTDMSCFAIGNNILLSINSATNNPVFVLMDGNFNIINSVMKNGVSIAFEPMITLDNKVLYAGQTTPGYFVLEKFSPYSSTNCFDLPITVSFSPITISLTNFLTSSAAVSLAQQLTYATPVNIAFDDSVICHVCNAQATINASTPFICNNHAVTLTSAGTYPSYDWSTLAKSKSISVVTGATYTLKVTDLYGCTSTTSYAIANRTVTANADPIGEICTGQPINLNATGGLNYAWVGPGGFTSAQATAVISNSSANNTGNYFVTVSDAQGCSSIDTVSVTVDPLPLVSTSSFTACTGGNLILNAIGDTANSYIWTGPSNYTSLLQTDTIFGIALVAAGDYVVVAVDSNSCSDSATASISVERSPDPAPDPLLLCQGDTVVLDANNGIGGVYAWSGPLGFSSLDENPMIINSTPAHSGIYVVTVSNNGCSATASLPLTVNPSPPVPTIHLSGDTLYSSSATGNQWLSSGIPIPGAIGNFYIPTGNGDYTVIFTDSNSCHSISANYSFVLGIENNVSHLINIYPSPANNYLFVEGLNNSKCCKRIKLVDITGKNVFDEETGNDNGVVTIPVGNLSNGIYMIVVTLDNSQVIQRVVINR